MSLTARSARWLSIVGIGEDGMSGLSPAARCVLEQAQLIVAGSRHLKMVSEIAAEKMRWPVPFERGIEAIVARRGTPVCVLASGDPFLYGVGSRLAAVVPSDEMLCVPAPSSLSLAAARLGWALQDCTLVSLHGRAFERIIPHLRPGVKLLVLAWDETTPARLAALMTERGFGASTLIVLEALGGAREKITSMRASEFKTRPIDALNITAMEIDVSDCAAQRAAFLPLTCGLSDEWFETDGQITKREIRALTLSSLAPWPGARLWDVGAGSGSVAIEWMLAHPRNQAWAIEAQEDRAARIARNALTLGVPDLNVVRGRAPQALEGLPSPDAIFVGGGGEAVIDAAWNGLPKGRRLVVNAVTLQTQRLLMERHAQHGGHLTSVSVAKVAGLGELSAWRPAMPVVQWSVTRK